jgi:hypothetical protein
MPPGAKKSWRFGRFFGGMGVIEMGTVVDIKGWADLMIVMWAEWPACGGLAEDGGIPPPSPR